MKRENEATKRENRESRIVDGTRGEEEGSPHAHRETGLACAAEAQAEAATRASAAGEPLLVIDNICADFEAALVLPCSRCVQLKRLLSLSLSRSHFGISSDTHTCVKHWEAERERDREGTAVAWRPELSMSSRVMEKDGKRERERSALDDRLAFRR